MKKLVLLAMAMLLCFAFVSFAGDDEGQVGQDMAMADAPWFDMPNCDFCKNLIKDENLLKNMTWENHEIHNGFVSITTVKPEFKAAYMEAMGAMMQLGNDMETGKVKPEEVKMCNYCKNYGMLMEAGAKFDYVMGDAAIVTVVTSDNPETLEKIKKFNERSIMEMAKWEEAEKAKKSE
ncbi:MAG: hypothetical protein ABIJ12_06660 [bacterium]